MTFVRNRKSQSSPSLDSRKISQIVHERRAQREREPATYRQNPEEAERQVRAYSPETRLRTIDEEARQLVDDARRIIRTWDPDVPSPGPWSWRTQYLALLLLNVMFTVWPLASDLNINSRDFPILAAVAASILGLLAISVTCYRQIGKLAWVGLGVSIVELAAFLTLVSRV
jgi:hypothetical protein